MTTLTKDRRPWAQRAEELEPYESVWCDYTAWKEWFNAADKDHDILGQLDSLAAIHLYSMFTMAYEGSGT